MKRLLAIVIMIAVLVPVAYAESSPNKVVTYGDISFTVPSDAVETDIDDNHYVYYTPDERFLMIRAEENPASPMAVTMNVAAKVVAEGMGITEDVKIGTKKENGQEVAHFEASMEDADVEVYIIFTKPTMYVMVFSDAKRDGQSFKPLIEETLQSLSGTTEETEVAEKEVTEATNDAASEEIIEFEESDS